MGAAGLWGLGRPVGLQSATAPHTGTMRAIFYCLSTDARDQEGPQRISGANIRHRRQTKDRLAAQRHAAEVRPRVVGELKREAYLYTMAENNAATAEKPSHARLEMGLKCSVRPAMSD